MMLINNYQFVAAGGETDPDWPTVVSLLHFDGSNNATTFVDQTGKTWSAIGNGKLSTARSQFGPSSFLGDGDNSGVLGTPDSAFDFGSGALTIAAWIYIAADSAPDVDGLRGANIFSTWDAGSGASNLNGYVFNISGSSSKTGTGLAFDTWSGGVGTLCRATVDIPQGVFNHIAVTVDASGVRRLFLNGALLSASLIQVGGGYSQANSLGSAPQIGRTQRASYALILNGNIDEFLVNKGKAQWTDSFTPPPTPYSNS